MDYSNKTKEDLIAELQDLHNKYDSIAELYGKTENGKVLNAEELRLKSIVNAKLIANIDDVIVIVDQDGINRYKSENIEKYFGWKPEDAIGKHALNNIHPDDLSNAQNLLQSIATVPNGTATLECRYRCKDLSYKWIQITISNLMHDPEIRGLLGNYHDITDRKLAEEALKEADWKFKALFEKGPIGVAYHVMVNDDAGNPIDYFFLDANKSYQELTGVDPRGKLVTEAFPGIEKDPFNWIGVFGKVARTGETIRFETYLAINQRWYDCVGYQYKPDHFVAAFLEITKAKATEFKLTQTIDALNETNIELSQAKILAENRELLLHTKNEEYESINEELKEANDALIISKERAEENDRLKTAFLQNMSHEIRTPMNAIIGFSDFLNDPELSAEKRSNFTTIIINSSKQLLSIVTDILTISSIETNQERINISKVSINNLIIELLAIFKLQATNQNISIYAKQQLTDVQSEIFTDRTKIEQILTNLLTNAFKFTFEGSIEFGYDLKDNELLFYVKDTGIGIKPELHTQIFERFRQAEIEISKRYSGTGLGLSISKGFVQLLGGNIWVESEHGKGATFYFTIPYRPANEIVAIDSTTAKAEQKTTILIAEDEEYNFLYLEEILHNLNVTIIHAKNGKETVEICNNQPTIDLILMDIKMPLMDGHTAALLIRAFKPDIPIIAQSAYALAHERDRYSGAAFDDYITKPIDKNELKQKIKKFIL